MSEKETEPHEGGECPVCDGSGKEDPDDESSEDCDSCDGSGQYLWAPWHPDDEGTCDYDSCPRADEKQELMILGCVSYCEGCYQKDHDALCGCGKKVSSVDSGGPSTPPS